MARTRKIRGGGKGDPFVNKPSLLKRGTAFLSGVFRKKTRPISPPIRKSVRQSARALETQRQKRTGLLRTYSTRNVKRFHTSVKDAKSPETLHAFIARLSPLPLQPLLQFQLAKGESIEMYEETEVFYDAKNAKELQKMIHETGLRLPPAKANAESLVLHEALYPSRLVRIETPRHDKTPEDDKDYENNDDTNDEDYSIKTSSIFLHPTIVEAVREDYTGVEKFDIPIFMAIEAPSIPGGGHMSILVIHRTIVYSLGFGYGGYKKDVYSKIPYTAKLISKGAFYNPDYLIEPQVKSPNNRHDSSFIRKYRIVDIGYMQPKHLAKLHELLAHCEEDISSEYKDQYFKTNMIAVKKEYHGLSWSPFVCASGGGAMNCTTFIEYVFGDRIDCSILPQIAGIPLTVSLPSTCKRRSGVLKNANLKQWFDEYNSEDHTYSDTIHNTLMGF